MDARIEYRNAEHYADPTAFEALKNIKEDKNKMEIYRGDIFYIKRISDRSTGELSEQGKPAVIVSSDEINERSEYINVCYVVNERENPFPSDAGIELCERRSAVACGSIHSVSVERVGDLIRECTLEELSGIERALMFSLGLEKSEKEITAENPPPVEKSEINGDLIKLQTERDLFRDLYENLLSRMVGGK